MDAICATLERGIEALCSDSDSHARAAASTLPSSRWIGDRCVVCRAIAGVSSEWLALRRYPVLVRWLLTRRQEITSQRLRLSRSYRVRSMAAVCAILDYCDLLLAPNVMTLLVSHLDTELLGAVIASRDVPIAARAILLATAIRQRQEQEPLAKRGEDMLPIDWLVAMQHEVRDTVVQDVTEASKAKRSKKRPRGSTASISQSEDKAVVLCRDCDVGKLSSKECARDDRRRRGFQALLHSLTSLRLPTDPNLQQTTEKQTLSQAIAALVEVLRSVLATSGSQGQRVVPRGRRVASQPRCTSNSRSVRWVEVVERARATLQEEEEEVLKKSLWGVFWQREVARRQSNGANPMVALSDVVEAMARIDCLVSSAREDTPSVNILLAVARSERLGRCDVLKALREAVQALSSSTQERGTAKSLLRTPAVGAIQRWLPRVLSSSVFNSAEPVGDEGQVSSTGSSHRRPRRHTRGEQPPMMAPETVLQMASDLSFVIEPCTGRQDQRVDAAVFSHWDSLFESVGRCLLQDASASSQSWRTKLTTLAHVSEVFADAKYQSMSTDAQRLVRYVTQVVHSLVVSNGTTTQLRNGSCAPEIPGSSTFQSDVLAFTSLLVSSLTPQAVAELFVTLTATIAAVDAIERTSVAATATASRTRWKRCAWNGIRRLLIPSLDSFLQQQQLTKAPNDRNHHPLLNTSLLEYLVNQVNQRLLRGISTDPEEATLRVVALVRLLWFWETNTSLSKNDDSSSAIEVLLSAGYDADADFLGVILRHFGHKAPDRLRSESQGFVLCLQRALERSVQHGAVLPALEGRLYQVMTAIRDRLSGSNAERDNTRLPSLVSHSDPALGRLLKVLHNDEDCRSLLSKLDDAGRLDELARCLQRWIQWMALETEKKETWRALCVIGARLLLWNEARDASRCLLAIQTPVDPRLVAAMHRFASSDSSLTDQQSAGSSVVRLSLMVRSYLSSSEFPDVAGFSALLADAVLHTCSASTRDALLKLLQSVQPWILFDVVRDRVQLALQPKSTRESLQQVRNAWWLLTTSPLKAALLRRPRDVFPIDTAVSWLPVLLKAIVDVDEHATQLSQLMFAATEDLLRLHAAEEDAASSWLARAFTLSALLSTSSCVAALLEERCLSERSERLDALAIRMNAIVNADGGMDEVDVGCQDGKHAHLLGLTRAMTQDSAQTLDQRYVRYCPTASPVKKNEQQEQHADCGSVTMAPPPMLAAWLCRFELANSSSPTLYLLPFDAWLRGITQHLCGDECCSASSRSQWETLFGDVVKSLYLSLEFRGDARSLQSVWLEVWLDLLTPSDAKRLSSLPFLRAQFWEISDADERSVSRWRLIAKCAEHDVAMDQTESSIASSLNAIVSALDLVQFAVIPWSFVDVKVLQEELENVALMVETLLLPRKRRWPLVAPLLEVWLIGTLKLERRQRDSSVSLHQRLCQSLRSADSEETSFSSDWREQVERWRRHHGHLHPQCIDSVCDDLKKIVW